MSGVEECGECGSPHVLLESRYALPEPSDPRVLPFGEGELFLAVRGLSSSWVLCLDARAALGYVPATYVRRRDPDSPAELLRWVDEALEKLHAEPLSKDTREVIKDLTRRRRCLLHTLKNSSSCEEEAEQVNVNGEENEAIANVHLPDVDVPSDTTLCDTVVAPSGSAEPSTVDGMSQTEVQWGEIPTWAVPMLIENVRNTTQLSHENSIAAVAGMIDTLTLALPRLSTSVWHPLRELLKTPEVVQDHEMYSEDKRKLQDIFRQLWYCKNDEQQRSWPVHEDEDSIAALLADLDTILEDANPCMTREVVRFNDFEMVNLLVTYYQMEPREVLRIKMLTVFMNLCALESEVITLLLNSILPTELARDIQDTFNAADEKIYHSICLLTLIFSTGDQPPNNLYDFFNDRYLDFLFDKIEEDTEMCDNILHMVLAFNLHLGSSDSTTLVMRVLAQRQEARLLTEKVLFLFNREEDPVGSLMDVSTDVPNSVLKFLVDMCSGTQLLQLFYLNDMKVVLDIIVRQLTDLPSGEKVRRDYLRLARNILLNSSYEDHMHQSDGLGKCFRTILAQEMACREEVALVTEISDSFPNWFPATES